MAGRTAGLRLADDGHVLLAYPLWAIRLALWWLLSLPRRLRRPPARVAFLLEAPPPEPPSPRRPFWQRFLGPQPMSVQDLARALRGLAAAAPRVHTVVLHLRPVTLSQAQVDALADVLAEVRAAGVRVACWAANYSADTYRLACAADEVLLQPGGLVAPLGLAREYVFLAETLERVGVSLDLLQVSPYKTAGDMLTRRQLSPEAREMADWLADAAFEETVSAIGAGRGLDVAAARALVDASPFTDEQALAAGAIDAIVGEEELPSRLGGPVQGWATARRRLPRPRPIRPGRYVGLIRVEGMILDGRSRRTPMRPPLAPPLLFGDQCGDLTVVEQARALTVDRRVGAVVLWVDSGGGSASASEAMAAALAQLARHKPLVAAMGAVAASGGYYVTTPAQRVYAHPGTVTGSIGVLAGKLVATGLLQHLLLHRDVVKRGANTTMWSSMEPFSEVERRKVGELIDRSYRLFLERVAAARHRTPGEIEPVAGGRVWTGRQALERGLVDELGGLDRAVAEARRLAGMAPNAPLREVRQARRDLGPPLPATGPAVIEHALLGLAALRGAGAWWLSPLVAD
jgi:protease-4